MGRLRQAERQWIREAVAHLCSTLLTRMPAGPDFDEQQRLIRTCPRVDTVPADNELDEQAYERAKDEVNDER
jgi:hypothetical protein